MPRTKNEHQELTFNEDYERDVLGILIKDIDTRDIMKLTVDDFNNPNHRFLLESIYELNNQSKPIELMVLMEHLHAGQNLAKAGGFSYISNLVMNAPAAENAKSYAKIVKKHALNRKVIDSGNLIQKIMSDSGDAKEKLVEVSGILEAISDGTEVDGQFIIKDVLVDTVTYIEHKFENKDKPAELPFGFVKLDELTDGAHEGELIIIAGRPGMGKTSLAMNIAETYSKLNKTGLAMSLEMGATQLGLRMISGVGSIDGQRLRTGNLLDEDWGRLTYAVGKVNSFDLFINDQASCTPNDIRSAAKQVVRASGKIHYIVVDYLQLMKGDKKKYNTPVEEITDISRNIKLLAKELKVPIIVLSQLNRSLEQRANKRPVMSDLRDSGAIEQDADLILFVYRDEVYNPDSAEKGGAEIIVGKQRSGPTGVVYVAYRGEFNKFEDFKGTGYGK
jgi:replicative DNA helicase